jgi:chorismate mutase
MDIADWRRQIDEVDRRIVELLSERAHAALEIGKLKRSTSLPVYEPNRERVIFENVRAVNRGPLSDIELVHVYERIVDVMRSIQKDEQASRGVLGTDAERAEPGQKAVSKTGETGKQS